MDASEMKLIGHGGAGTGATFLRCGQCADPNHPGGRITQWREVVLLWLDRGGVARALVEDRKSTKMPTNSNHNGNTDTAT
jgi:hypothetical protein